jgi:serine O-acetyltransferase
MGLLADARNIQEKDPAARSVAEVILLYPGFHILVYHRIAHWLYVHRHFFLARWISQRGRHKTGIEIHPGAKIGKCLFIDHGMGIVFGETTEIGDNCTIYHGVTLGGTGKDTGKRHPTLGNNVLIGAGTKVLGPVFIGDNARVGAGSVVLHNLPANCTAVGVPAEVVRINNKAVCPSDDLDQQDLPDIVSLRLTELERRIGVMEAADRGGVPPSAREIAGRAAAPGNCPDTENAPADGR